MGKKVWKFAAVLGAIVATWVLLINVFHNVSTITYNTTAKNMTEPSTDDESEKMEIEARVIFGDYNDDGEHNYKESQYTPIINLKSNGEKVDVEGKSVYINEWRYQYAYAFEVEKSTNKNYYVELENVTDGKITLGDKEFTVYYLRDDRLGMPGLNGDTDGDGKGNFYPTNPEDSSRSDEGVIYIYLDPTNDWQGNPDKIDITFKKRWDSHDYINAKPGTQYDIRPKEKLQIQLQKWDEKSNKWLRYDSNNFKDDNYEFKSYFEVLSPTHEAYFVDESVLDAEKAETDSDGKKVIYRKIVDGEDKYYYDKAGTKPIDYDTLFDFATLKENNKISTNGENVNRFKLCLDESEWNDVVASMGGNNHVPVFEGYYFKWNALPKGEYRVIELRTFIDNNDDNKYDDGDTDISGIYYYMEFPPTRNSTGVLHAGNYTQKMFLEVHKEWYDSNDKDEDGFYKYPGKIPDGLQSGKVKFNLYRSVGSYDNPSFTPKYEGYVGTYETDENGYWSTLTEGLDLPTQCDYTYTSNGETYSYLRDCYYYIQEVEDDSYSLMNGNLYNFVPNTRGNYYAKYDDGDARIYVIKNQPTPKLSVEKKWIINGNEVFQKNILGDLPQPEFEIYRSTVKGEPVVKDGEEGYFVDDIKLDKIAEAKTGKDGKLTVEYGQIEGLSKEALYKTPKLRVTDDYTYELYVDSDKTDDYGIVYYDYKEDKTANLWVSRNAEWFNINGEKANNARVSNNMFTINRSPSIYLKPKTVSDLRLEFDVNDNGKQFYFSNQNIRYTIPEDGVVELKNISANSNYAILADSSDVHLIKATFTSKTKVGDSYIYYVREKISDSDKFVQIKSNDYGFAQIGKNDEYYVELITNSNDGATVAVPAVNKMDDIEIELSKSWYADDKSEHELTEMEDKSFRFKVYKAPVQGTAVKSGDKYQIIVGDNKYDLIEVQDKIGDLEYKNGYYESKTDGTVTLTNLSSLDGNKSIGLYYKVYYYIQEFGGNFKLLNGDANRFAKNNVGEYGSYFTEEDNSNKVLKFELENQPLIKLTINKKWMYSNGEKVTENIHEMTFVILSSTEKIENKNIVFDSNSNKYIVEGNSDIELTEVRKETTKNFIYKTFDLPAYNIDGTPLYYYVIETDGENGSYSVKDFDVSYNTSGNDEWIKYDDNGKTINVTNKMEKRELAETGQNWKLAFVLLISGIVLLTLGLIIKKCKKA